MNVRLRKSAATKIHLQIIHSSFVRRTSSSESLNLFIHPYTLLLIWIFCCNNLCPAFRNDKVPFQNHNSTSNSLSLNSSLSFKSTESSLKSLSFDQHDDQNIKKSRNQNFKLSSNLSESSTNGTFSNDDLDSENNLLKQNKKFVDNRTKNFLISSLVDRLRKERKEFDYLSIDDKNDLVFLKNSSDIFLNLTEIKLKRDQRNLELKNNQNDTNQSIRLIDNQTINQTIGSMNTSNLLDDNLSIGFLENINDLVHNYIKETKNSNIDSSKKYQQQLIADQQKTIINNFETSAINLVEPASSNQTKDSQTMAVSMSILYIIIFFTGVLGNLGKRFCFNYS